MASEVKHIVNGHPQPERKSVLPELSAADVKTVEQIGKGGFSTVFRAKITLNGALREAAVNKLNNRDAFIQERDNASTVQQQKGWETKVVRRLAQCSAELVLVYELMPAGDLLSHLPKAALFRCSFSAAISGGSL